MHFKAYFLLFHTSLSSQRRIQCASPKRAGNLLPHAPKLRHNVGWVCGADMCVYLWLWRILDFLNALPTPQQLGNRTLPRARPEPWMANAPMCPAKAAGGRFCRFDGLRPNSTTSIRAFRKSYIRNPEQIRTHICTAYPSHPNAPSLTYKKIARRLHALLKYIWIITDNHFQNILKLLN